MIVFFDEMTDVEKEKLKAVTENNMPLLEECMNKEQANILKLRGLDKKREQIQCDLSFEKLSFKEIIPLLAGEDKMELGSMLNEILIAVSLYKKYSENAKTAIEVNIHIINQILNQMKNKKDTKGISTYSLKKKTDITTTRNLTSRKI